MLQLLRNVIKLENNFILNHRFVKFLKARKNEKLKKNLFLFIW